MGKKLIAKQLERKAGVDSQIKDLDIKITGVRTEIDQQNEALKTIDTTVAETPTTATEATDGEPPNKKVKLNPTEQQQYELQEAENNYQGMVEDQATKCEV